MHVLQIEGMCRMNLELIVVSLPYSHSIPLTLPLIRHIFVRDDVNRMIG